MTCAPMYLLNFFLQVYKIYVIELVLVLNVEEKYGKNQINVKIQYVTWTLKIATNKLAYILEVWGLRGQVWDPKPVSGTQMDFARDPHA